MSISHFTPNLRASDSVLELNRHSDEGLPHSQSVPGVGRSKIGSRVIDRLKREQELERDRDLRDEVSSSISNDSPPQSKRDHETPAITLEEETSLVMRTSSSAPNAKLSDVDKLGNTLLHSAVLEGFHDRIASLSSMEEVDINARNKRGATPFLFACFKSDLTAIKLLLAQPKMDPDLANNEGITALHLLCGLGFWEGLTFILRSQKLKELNPKYLGETPLHVACRGGHNRCVRALVLQRGVKKDEPNLLQETPLHIACVAENGHHCVSVLIRANADVNLQEINGNTPLHCAVAKDRVQSVRRLLSLSYDLDINKQNHSNETPYELATRRKGNRSKELLLATGKVIVQLARIVSLEEDKETVRKNRKNFHTKWLEENCRLFAPKSVSSKS